MRILNFEIDWGDISIASMIIFALIAMFFLGYYLAYDNAIINANDQINDVIHDYELQHNIISWNHNISSVPVLEGENG